MAGPRLLIRLGSLGDVVLATAAANAVHDRFGAGSLDVLVKSEWAGIWRGHPAVRNVLPWSPGERGLAGLRRWSARLRAAEYAEAIDLQASLRTQTLTRLAGIRRVHRPERHALRRRLFVRWKRFGPPATYRVAQAFTDTVTPDAVPRPSIHPSAGARERAEALLPRRGGIGLIPGARHATKRWPLERFAGIGRRAAGARGPVPVFFGPDEEGLQRELAGIWPDREAWTPVRTDLETAAACLARLDAVLSNDTGLMHVAAAVGTRVVAIFGPTVRSFGFEPVGGDHEVLEVAGLSCRPCSPHGGTACPRGHFRCMRDLGPDLAASVLDRVAQENQPASLR